MRVSAKAKYFSQEGLTRFRKIRPTGKSVGEIGGKQEAQQALTIR
jgi:hypothetical protein